MNKVTLIHSTPKGDELIAYMARVSNPTNQSNPRSEKLIKYLITHKHWSPFEMVNMCVEINTTRSISAQLLRHRSFSFQEFSQRYSDVNQLGDPILPQVRRQDVSNRQNSIADIQDSEQEAWDIIIKNHFDECVGLYKAMLIQGVAKECAREVLPLASPSRLYMNGTLRSWLHYVELRSGPETQLEHRQIALDIKDLIKSNFPLVFKATFS